MLNPPYPELDELLHMLGEAGRRCADLDSTEGAAGNISACLRWPVDPRATFPISEVIDLPLPIPALAGATVLASGSGRRLREIIEDPPAHIACIVVHDGGRTATLHTCSRRRFERVTSEFNSHLAVHHDQLLATGANFHALVHAHPPHLTYLSHIPHYQDERYLNARLLRWQPETIINLPEGIGFAPFRVPSSSELMAANVECLRKYRVVVWSKHGAVARSDISVKRAVDRLEYAETAARYEYLSLATGGLGEGLSAEELRAICRTFNLEPNGFI